MSFGRKRAAQWGSVIGNTGFLVANTMGLAATGLAFWVIAARRFAPEEVGLATALISATLLVTLVSTSGFGFSTLRELPRSGNSRGGSGIVNTSLAVSGGTGVAGAAIFVAAAPLFVPAVRDALSAPWMIVCYVAWVGLQTASAVLDNALTAIGRSDLVFWKNLAANGLKLALAPTLPVDLGAFAVFAANTIPIGLTLLAAVAFVLPRALPGYTLRASPDFRVARKLAQFAVVAHASHLLVTAPQLALPFLVFDGLGARETAFFYTSWKIAGLLWAVATAASGPLLAHGSARPEAYRVALSRVLLLSCAAAGVATALLALFARDVLRLFGPEYAANSAPLLVLLAASATPLILFTVYLTTLRVAGSRAELLGASGAFAASALVAALIVGDGARLASYGRAWLAVTGAFGLFALVRLYGPAFLRLAAPRGGSVGAFEAVKP